MRPNEDLFSEIKFFSDFIYCGKIMSFSDSISPVICPAISRSLPFMPRLISRFDDFMAGGETDMEEKYWRTVQGYKQHNSRAYTVLSKHAETTLQISK